MDGEQRSDLELELGEESVQPKSEKSTIQSVDGGQQSDSDQRLYTSAQTSTDQAPQRDAEPDAGSGSAATQEDDGRSSFAAAAEDGIGDIDISGVRTQTASADEDAASSAGEPQDGGPANQSSDAPEGSDRVVFEAAGDEENRNDPTFIADDDDGAAPAPVAAEAAAPPPNDGEADDPAPATLADGDEPAPEAEEEAEPEPGIALTRPEDVDASDNVIAENAADGDSIGVTVQSQGEGVTYSLSSDSSNGGFQIDPNTGEITVADGSKLDFETAQQHSITVQATDANGDTSTETFTIDVNDQNEFDISSVIDIDDADNRIAEDIADGAPVGLVAFAEDADGTTNGVTYSIAFDSSGGGFEIDPATGAVTVADTTLLDFEEAQQHTVTVLATSDDGSTSLGSFEIDLTDANEFAISQVIDNDATANEVAEGAADGASVGVTAFAFDDDGADNGVSYSISGDSSNGGFQIDPDTGEITVADGSKLDFETAQQHTVTVVATSEDGSTSSESFTIALTDEDEFDVSAVTDSDSTANEVAEGAATGASVGVTAFASDDDGSNSGVTYSLSGDSSNGGFQIDPNTGEITVADGSKLDFETDQQHTVTVVATSEDGSTAAESFTIALTDEDEFDVSAVTDTDATANEVAEGAATGASVGVTAFASDADGSNNGVSYSLSGDTSNGGFQIDPDTGEITVADGAKLDFETAQQHTVTVTATSEDGSTASESFTIDLTDENEFDVSAITDTDATANEVAEGAANGASVGVTAFASDADGVNNGVTYSLSGDSSNGGFQIDPNTGEITVADGTKLDFETAQQHTVTVVATSEDGSTSSESFTIELNDEDEFDVSAITDTDATANQVAEGAANGASVGVTAFASDADGSNNGVAYSLSGDSSNGGFQIDAETGEITVADGSKLDFETAQQHTVTVVATSEDGSTSTESFTIALTDEDEFDVSAITDTDATANEVAEGASTGASVGVTAFASDADGTNNGVTYSLSGDSSNGGFTIDADTGEITVADGSKLDFETAQQHTVTVVATSEDGSASSESFTIALTDEDEFDVSAVTDSDFASNEVAEGAATGASVGVTAFASDDDGTNSDVTYSLSGDSSDGGFQIDPNTGEITVADGSKLDFETAQQHTVTVVATSEDGSTSSESFTIELNDEDEFDVSAVTDTDATANEVAEGAATGASVGVTAFASDADGSNNGVTYSLSGDSSNGGFQIDSETGEITVADGSKLDFETAQQHTVTVVATSEDGSTSTESFTIALTDEDEFDVSAVTDTDATVNEVAEGAATGASVGVTAFASDDDGTNNGVTYSLSGDSSNGGFTIDADTGEITVADGSKLDFETAQQHTVTVVATSEDGSASSESFTIALTDEDEFDVSAVTDTDATANEVAEGAATGASVGVTAFASDADGSNNDVTYSLSGDSSNGGFQIDPNTGEITVADSSKLDFETAQQHTVTVVATSEDGSTATESFTIGLTDEDEFDVSAVTDADATANEVAEGAATGASVGVTAFASDADGTNNGVTYSLSGDSSNGGFEIDPNTGEITVADGSKLDFETAQQHTVTVVATSEDGSTATESFTIGLTDEDEFDVSAVTDTDAMANEVAEGAATGASVGVTAFASDDDGTNNGVTYSLSGDSSNGGFEIDPNTGEITVADGSKLDFETAQQHTVTVVATSEDGSTSSESFTIGLTDEDEFDVSAVTDTDATANEVAEGAATGASVGVTAFASDADGTNNGVTYSLSGDSSNGGFQIDADTGEITVADGSKLDFETAQQHTVTVVATSEDGSTSSESFTIGLTDEDEFDVSAVTDTDATANEVAEGAATGATVGVTAFASDADGTNNGVTYSLSGDSSNGGFQIDPDTGEITVADGSKLDFETAQQHTVTVVATSEDGSTSSESFTIALTDEDEFDVSAVTDSDSAANEVAEGAANGASVGVTAFASDDDGSNNGVIYSLSGDSSNGGFEIDANTGEITVADGSKLDFETAQQHTVTVVATSEDGSASSESFTIALTDEDEFDVSAVTDSDSTANEVAEGAANGASVGVTAFASDDDGTNNNVTYSLSGDSSSGGFQIDADTGEITVADGSKLDFETAQQHTVTVVATSEDGSTSSESFTIGLTDEDEFDVSAVTDSDSAANEVAEGAANGATVGVTAFASDADGTNNGVTYSLSGDTSNGGFEIDPNTGEITVADGSKLDFETAQQHTVTVVATSEDGSTSSESFTIGLTDEDEFDVSAVTDTDATANEVAEGAATGASVGVTAFASDADGTNNGVTYSLSGDSSNGGFQIDADTGEITVADGSKLDFETAQQHTVTVVATSEDGSTSSESFTIGLTDENEFDVSAVTDSDSAANEVAEGAADGATVGVTAFASDDDSTNNGVTYSLSGDTSNGGFEIDPNTGEITVADGSKLDFETAQQHTVTVVATSEDGSTSSESFTIALTDEDEFDVSAVTDTDATANEVAEGAATGASVGVTAFASDDDGSNSGVTYSLSGDSSNGGFQIDANTGEITVADGSKLDFETAQQHTVTVVATSEDGSTSSESFTIGLTDENEFDVSAVTDLDATANEIVEGATNGASVGVTAFASDADSSDNGVTYALSADSSNGGFEIDANTGEITVADGAKLNFETAQQHTVTVVATSEDGSTSTESFTIALTDVDEFDVSAVTDTDIAANEVAEGAATGASVGVTAFAADADGSNNDVTYSLSGDSSDGGFQIDANTGEITVADGSKLDFETDQQHTVTVVATSEDGSTSSESFTIGVTDQNEFDVSAVTDADAAANEVVEGAMNGTSVGVTAFAFDADSSNNNVTYNLSSDSSNGGFTINAGTGEITVADGAKLNFETAQEHTVTVVATSEDGSTSTESFTIALTDIDEFNVSAVTDTDSATNEVAEGAANGASVGVTAFAADADGSNDGVTYSLSGDSSNGGFEIDPNTGEITVADGSKLDFETAQQHTVTVVATSEDGSTSSESFTIGLTDEDEFDVSAVTDSDSAANEVAEGAATGASVGVTAFASDADGSNDGVTYALSGDSSDGGFQIDPNTGEITVADGSKLDFETAQQHTVTVVATSEDGSTSSESFTIGVTDQDEFDVSAVTDTDATTNEVAEGAANGASVGVTAFASDADSSNNNVTYALSADSSNGGFEIDPNTGEITVADGSKLDFETAQQHTVTVVATSEDGSTSSESFTIGLTDEDEFDVSAVADSDTSANEVAEGATAGASVGVTAFASDADGTNNGVTYSLSSDSSNGGFEIDANTGEITVADGSKLDFETAQQHTVTVVATSEDGSTSSESFTIGLTDENEFDVSAVTDADAAANEVVEGATNGTSVGVTAFASDADSSNNGVTYNLSADSSNGGFTIDQNTGEITVADGTKLNFETAQQHTVTVEATSEDGSTSTESFTIALTDVDEFDVSAVTDSDATANEVAEGAANGASVGVTAFAADADGSNDGVTYSFSGDSSNGGFEIDPNTGEITVADGSKLDFETAQQHTVTVVATSEDGSTSSESFTIALTDDDEFDVSAVTDSDATANEVAEGAATGASVGVTAFASDADGSNDGVTYSLNGDSSNGGFTIDADTGEITVADGSKLDFEADQQHTVTVVATSEDGSTSSESFTIALTDADEFDVSAVTDADATANEVAEGAATGASVGVTAFASDADSSNSNVTYSLSGDTSNGGFTIDADTGEITVADGSKLDFETAQQHTVTVVATSEDGSTSSESFTIGLTDEDEFDVSAVTDSDATTNEVAEGAATGTSVGVTAFAADVDGSNNGVTYSLGTDSSNGGFQIDANTGEITVADGSKLDFETAEQHTVTVVATSEDGSTSSATFAIGVTDENEFSVSAVTDTDVTANEVEEGAATGTSVGVTAFASDADGSNSDVTYSLSADSSNGGFEIDADTGEITVADGSKLDFETAQQHTVTVVATSEDGSTSSENFTIALTDDDEFDVSAVTDTDSAANEVAEGAANGATVGVTAFASDADGTNNGVTYSLSGDTSNGGFEIDPNTGEITVADGSKLDFETAQQHTVTVVATSGDGSTSSESFTIALTDEDEFDVSAVTDTDATANEVAEGAATGASVGVTAFASDDDGTNNGVTYSLSGDSSNGGFQIDADTGEITVADGSKLDFETAQQHTVTVVATSEDGSTSSESFTIGLTDRGEPDIQFTGDQFTGGAESHVAYSEWHRDAQITALEDGGYVVVWPSGSHQDGDTSGVYGQKFDADGHEVGGEFQINTHTSSTQDMPAVTALKGGGFTVAWSSNGQDGSSYGIYGQSFDTDANATGDEFLVNTTTSGSQDYPDIAGLEDGGYVVVWTSYDQDGSGNGVFAQQFDSDGVKVGGETQINVHTSGNQDEASVTGLADGGYAVTWASNGQDGSSDGVYVRQYDANGAPVGGEVRVNTETDDTQNNPHIAGLTGGGYVVAWESDDQDGSGEAVYAQMYDANGDPIGGEIHVSASRTSGDQDDAHVVALNDGGFVMMWESSGQDGSGEGMRAQIYDDGGNKVGDEFQVNDTTSGDQREPAVTQTADGDLVFIWQTTTGSENGSNQIVQRTFSASLTEGSENGESIGSVTAAGGEDGETYTFSLGDDNGGRFAIDPSTGEISLENTDLIDFENQTSHDVTVVVTDSNGIEYTETISIDVVDDGAIDEVLNDIKVGGSGDDGLDGDSGGDDELLGMEGDDSLSGGPGDDTLHGGSGNDDLDGGDGNDIMFGGTGDDVMAGQDGDDVMVGGEGADIMAGGAGADLFLAGEGLGNDSIDGGSDSWTDTIQLEASDGDLGAYGVDWTVTITEGSVISTDADSIELSDNADGTIDLADGTQISFQDVERIQF